MERNPTAFNIIVLICLTTCCFAMIGYRSNMLDVAVSLGCENRNLAKALLIIVSASMLLACLCLAYRIKTAMVPLFFTAAGAVFFVFFLFVDFAIGIFVIPKDAEIRCASPVFHHGLKPNKSGIVNFQSPYKMNTNSLGFRDATVRDVPKEFKEKHRILFVGDSFVEGIGLPFEETFVGMMYDYGLRNNISVLNAGVASYSPLLYYYKTKQTVDDGVKFDVLVVFVDISDIQDEIVYQKFVQAEETVLDKIKTYAFQHSFFYRYVYPKQLKTSWMNNALPSRTYDFGNNYYTVRGCWSYDKEEFAKWGQNGLNLCSENMEKLFKICQRNNIIMILAVYPWPETIKYDVVNSVQVNFWKIFCKDRGIVFLDYFPEFMGNNKEYNIKNLFIPGDVHWNARGHKVIYNKLIETFRSLGI